MEIRALPPLLPTHVSGIWKGGSTFPIIMINPKNANENEASMKKKGITGTSGTDTALGSWGRTRPKWCSTPWAHAAASAAPGRRLHRAPAAGLLQSVTSNRYYR